MVGMGDGGYYITAQEGNLKQQSGGTEMPAKDCRLWELPSPAVKSSWAWEGEDILGGNKFKCKNM